MIRVSVCLETRVNTGRSLLFSTAKKYGVSLAMCGLVVLGTSCVQESDPIQQQESNIEAPSQPQATPKLKREFIQNFNDRSEGRSATFTVESTKLGTVLSEQNIGISFESTELSDPRWDPDVGNLDEMLLALGKPGLRFGGNKLDRSIFWSSTGENAPKGKTLVTPQDLRRVMKTVQTIDAKVTLGIPLGTFDPERGADMTKHATEIFGEHLVGVSIGNEPNGFTSDARTGLKLREPETWNESEYIKQVRSYIDALDAEVKSDVPIIGPGVFDGSWMSAFLTAEIPNTAALTQHYYATYECSSTAVPGRGPEWQNLLNPIIAKSSSKMFSIGLAKAKKAKVPLWVEETGSTSCPGTNNTSKTHATALWTVDHIFSAAQQGVERMNMHSMLGACRGGAPMSVLCSAEGTGARGEGELLAQPNYLAMRLTQISSGGHFLKVSASGDSNLRSYAVRSENGTISVTIVNKNNAAGHSFNPVEINVPKGYRATRAAQLHGPDNESIEDTELAIPAPISVKSNGVKKNTDGHLQIELAASTATTIEFTKE